MKTICLLLLAVLCGCQMQADAVKTGATLNCVDTRDGERFSFKDESIRDVAYGIGADSCMTVTDNAGKERRLCKSHEAFLKCEKSPAPLTPELSGPARSTTSKPRNHEAGST